MDRGWSAARLIVCRPNVSGHGKSLPRFIWGFDYNFTNYNFRTTLECLNHILPEGWNSMLIFWNSMFFFWSSSWWKYSQILRRFALCTSPLPLPLISPALVFFSRLCHRAISGYIYIYIYIHTYVGMYAHIYIYIYIYICIGMYVIVIVIVNIYIYIYTHRRLLGILKGRGCWSGAVFDADWLSLPQYKLTKLRV